MTSSPRPAPQRTWTLGHALLMVPPFIGLVIVFLDVPRWVEVVGVVAIIALVFAGTRLLYRRRGGWQPSATLPEPRDRDR